ncbi:FMN-linked oxidoreductase [Exidia glandulosa HHB12029]|uniref:FMN-linked oxidoreductase n=1 Tax=Exidia glandulosa HHB12029 TaxID=1314781 RepID=A0A166A6A3_EXIGL|nr:FMN-linked oxidoreductase [Exidia glandulosa HHB12029]
MPGAPTSHALFEPIRIGDMDLAHRVVLAPLTRIRATDDHIPTEMMLEYYRQRSSTPGTFLLTEATLISQRAGGFINVPGVWNDAQVAEWKKIVDVVHANGCYIYCQLWALGRAASAEQLALEMPGADVVSSGDVQQDPNYVKPRPMTHAEIDEMVTFYADAAKNAVFGAGFDGVEIHGANGYLVDQFINEVTNNRTDEYGGSIEKRLKFPLRVVDAVIQAVGVSRTAIRLSPYERFSNMLMDDPIPTFSAMISELKTRNIAYLHIIESRAASAPGVYNPPAPGSNENPETESLDFARKIWAPQPIILAGGYTPERAVKRAEEAAARGENAVIAFGRYFIANPDLPLRLRKGIPLTRYDRSTFYAIKQAAGYIDYPFAVEANGNGHANGV